MRNRFYFFKIDNKLLESEDDVASIHIRKPNMKVNKLLRSGFSLRNNMGNKAAKKHNRDPRDSLGEKAKTTAAAKLNVNKSFEFNSRIHHSLFCLW